MSENINETVPEDETDSTDVEGHYLPQDDEGNADLAPHKDSAEDVEGHVLDVDVERKR